MDRATRKLARQIFHGMIRYQARLERKQAFLFRAVEIGAELFAMAATVSRAASIFEDGNRNAVNLADLFCRNARKRIEARFDALWSNSDDEKTKLARQVMDKQFMWVEKGGAGLKNEERYQNDTVRPAEDKFVEEVISSIIYSD